MFPSARGGRKQDSRIGESSVISNSVNNTDLVTPATTKHTVEEIWRTGSTYKKQKRFIWHKTTNVFRRVTEQKLS